MEPFMEPSGSDRGLKAFEMGAFAEAEPRSRTVTEQRPYSDSVTDNAKKQQSPAKPYKERIDPGGEFGKQTTGLAALAASPIGRVLRWLGVDQATLDQTKELEETYRRLTEEPDRISAALAPLGGSSSSSPPSTTTSPRQRWSSRARSRRPRNC
jgi:hypothetical protein